MGMACFVSFIAACIKPFDAILPISPRITVLYFVLSDDKTSNLRSIKVTLYKHVPSSKTSDSAQVTSGPTVRILDRFYSSKEASLGL